MRGLFMSRPPTRVAPIWDGAGSWSRMPSGRKPTSTQSSMLVNRSTMPVSRVTMAANLSSARPVCSCLGVVHDRLEPQHAFALGVALERQQPEVDLEEGQVPPRSLDHDRLSGRQCRDRAMRAAVADAEQGAQLRHVEPGPGPVHDGVEHALHHRAGGEDQVPAVLDLVDRVGVAEAAAAAARRGPARSTGTRCRSSGR